MKVEGSGACCRCCGRRYHGHGGEGEERQHVVSRYVHLDHCEIGISQAR